MVSDFALNRINVDEYKIIELKNDTKLNYTFQHTAICIMNKLRVNLKYHIILTPKTQKISINEYKI